MNNCEYCDRDHGLAPVTVQLGRRALWFCRALCARNFLEDWVQLAHGELNEVEHLAGTKELRPNEAAFEN